MLFFVDRIEELTAVCEDETGLQFHFPLELLPDSVRDGSALRLENGLFTLDYKAESERRCTLFSFRESFHSDETKT